MMHKKLPFIAFIAFLFSGPLAATQSLPALELLDDTGSVRPSLRGLPFDPVEVPLEWSMQPSLIGTLTCPVFYHWDPLNFQLIINVEKTFSYGWFTQGIENKMHQKIAEMVKSCVGCRDSFSYYQLEKLGLMPMTYDLTPEQALMLLMTFLKKSPFDMKPIRYESIHDDWISFGENINSYGDFDDFFRFHNFTKFWQEVSGDPEARTYLRFFELKNIIFVAPSYSHVRMIDIEDRPDAMAYLHMLFGLEWPVELNSSGEETSDSDDSVSYENTDEDSFDSDERMQKRRRTEG
jgi:hypothetical protein